MLSQCYHQVGLEGMCRILSDSFSHQEISQLVESFGLLNSSVESQESNILALAHAGMESPERDQGISELLDRKNSNLIEAISESDPTLILENYIPQNPDCSVAPGRILWTLCRLPDTPDLKNLLGIWNDYLKEAAPSFSSSEEEEFHDMDEARIAQAELQAVESFKNDMEPSSGAELKENDRHDQEIKDAIPSQMEGSDRDGLKSDLLLDRIEKIEAEQETIQTTLTQIDQRLQKMERLFVSSMGGPYESSSEQPIEDSEEIPSKREEEERPFSDGEESFSAEIREEEIAEIPDPEDEEEKPLMEEVLFAEPVDERGSPFEEKPVAGEEVDQPVEDHPKVYPDEPVLQQETIVLVGGNDHLTDEYEHLIKAMGGCFERYASIDEFSPQWLEGLVDHVHLIIVLGNAATRPGTFRLMEITERLGKRLYVHHSTAPASLRRMLLKLVEQEVI